MIYVNTLSRNKISEGQFANLNNLRVEKSGTLTDLIRWATVFSHLRPRVIPK